MVDTAGAILAILTRAPSSGGKSRLFQALGMQPDVELLRCLLLDTLDGATLPALRRVIAVTPGSACDEIREIIGDASQRSTNSAEIYRSETIPFGVAKWTAKTVEEQKPSTAPRSEFVVTNEITEEMAAFEILSGQESELVTQ